MGNPINFIADKLKMPSITDFILDNTVTPIIGERDKTIDFGFINAILTTVIPMGQLWSRTFLLDGSMDKLWLLFPLFLIPPFSFIPSLLMYLGYVKKGKGGAPYDIFMIIPIISKFLLAFLVPYFLNLFYDPEEDAEPSDVMIFITTFIVQLVVGMIPNIIRTSNLCKEIKFNSFGKAFIDSTIANSAGELLPFILGWLPFVGWGLTLIEMIPYVGDQVVNILWAIGFCIGYMFINMFNADSICSTGFFGKDNFDKFSFIIMLSITIFIKVFNEISPI